ncbi:30S ribosomal protein S17e [Nanoarchaeota archaeon]
MGRIKTMQIKRKTREILAKHSDDFKEDFNENKVQLDKITEIPSKKLRNAIAGYITRLKKKTETL